MRYVIGFICAMVGAAAMLAYFARLTYIQASRRSLVREFLSKQSLLAEGIGMLNQLGMRLLQLQHQFAKLLPGNLVHRAEEACGQTSVLSGMHANVSGAVEHASGEVHIDAKTGKALNAPRLTVEVVRSACADTREVIDKVADSVGWYAKAATLRKVLTELLDTTQNLLEEYKLASSVLFGSSVQEYQVKLDGLRSDLHPAFVKMGHRDYECAFECMQFREKNIREFHLQVMYLPEIVHAKNLAKLENEVVRVLALVREAIKGSEYYFDLDESDLAILGELEGSFAGNDPSTVKDKLAYAGVLRQTITKALALYNIALVFHQTEFTTREGENLTKSIMADIRLLWPDHAMPGIDLSSRTFSAAEMVCVTGNWLASDLKDGKEVTMPDFSAKSEAEVTETVEQAAA